MRVDRFFMPWPGLSRPPAELMPATCPPIRETCRDGVEAP
jgi:hypothetical protein